jgi:uncharacterized protein (TIGR03083 family)
VRDVISHLAGNVSDVLDHRDGIATTARNASQIEERSGRSVEEVLAEWQERAPAFVRALPRFPGLSGQLAVADLVTHDLDVRGAVGRPPRPEGPAFDLALQSLIDAMDHRLERKELPALTLLAGGSRRTAGRRDPAAQVEAPPFELPRALAGRRSARQVSNFKWEGSPEPYLPVFSIYPMPHSDILE